MKLTIDKRGSPTKFSNATLGWDNSYGLNKHVSELSKRRCYLSFSCGKDGVAAWLYLKELEMFDEIVPYFLGYDFDHQFIQDALNYYEDEVLHTYIHRIPCAGLYNDWANGTYLAPHQLHTVLQYRNYIYPRTNDDVDNMMRKRDRRENWYIGVGVKISDGMQRRGSISQNGGLRKGIGKWFPIFDFTDLDVVAIIKAHNVKLPYDYALWGRTYDGVQYRFYKELYRHHQNERELIKQTFPQSDMLLYRYAITKTNNMFLSEQDLGYLNDPQY